MFLLTGIVDILNPILGARPAAGKAAPFRQISSSTIRLDAPLVRPGGTDHAVLVCPV